MSTASATNRASLLQDLGVLLRATQRPPMPGAGVDHVRLRLQPSAGATGPQVVSFGLPFAPGDLLQDHLIYVTDEAGVEVAVYTAPIASWWIDGRQGSLRSVLVQFDMDFAGEERWVRIGWDGRRERQRSSRTPIAETQIERQADGFVFHQPKVLALLPPSWLCASLVAWQQVPASDNEAAPWFDRHLLAQFPGSVQHIASSRYAPHLYDRPATYAKIYVRHGSPQQLTAALQAADFYVQHLGEDGFFTLKPGDHKYVYAEGAAILYLLTGDDRFRQAVLRTLTSWAKWTRVAYTGEGFWTERHAAFGMAAYLHTYELTGDPARLQSAMLFFDGVYRLQVRPLDGAPADGAWLHTAESHGDGNGFTTSPWMSALLMDSIWKLWMLTGDDRCPASLAMYAKFIDRYGVSPDRKQLYYMANSPGRGASINPENPPHHLEACYMLAMGYYLSGGHDTALTETLQGLWPALLADGANNPPRKLSWRFRETSMLVWFLQHARQGQPE
jgi:hypothetical protein